MIVRKSRESRRVLDFLAAATKSDASNGSDGGHAHGLCCCCSLCRRACGNDRETHSLCSCTLHRACACVCEIATVSSAGDDSATAAHRALGVRALPWHAARRPHNPRVPPLVYVHCCCCGCLSARVDRHCLIACMRVSSLQELHIPLLPLALRPERADVSKVRCTAQRTADRNAHVRHVLRL